MAKPIAPIPHKDGIAPSFVGLPQGDWPLVLDFLIARFPHVAAEDIRGRLLRGEVVDEAGTPYAVDSPYRAGTVLWYYRPQPEPLTVPFAETILYQDDILLVVDKPHFLPVTPVGRYALENLQTRLRQRLDNPEITTLHRLDKETAGVILFCQQPAHRHAYHALFESRQVQKTYEAIAGFRRDLVLPYVHHSRIENRDDAFTVQEVAGAPNSETAIELIEQRGDYAHYRLAPHTGRKHQLRVHLAGLGIPIVNDAWYPELMPDKGNDFSSPLQLLARTIEFIDPVTGEARQFSSQRALVWPAPSMMS
ncbi:pseudouridine synthase [Deefgea salmonis]|uniref:Pseudouridine synthase n=1 Tax=Deefgea salmonis TaxID=2875502 RepID=A0ABS8BP95_9NEIS|nr:pseudouridine synthase [Deefgea salmonis]MCB5197399.1 pseudouridine synthase [Deefgea salmonis]